MARFPKPQPTEPAEPFRFGVFFEARGRPPDGFVQALAALRPLLPWLCLLATIAVIGFAIKRFA